MGSPTYCNDLPSGYENNECANEPGGVIAVALVHSSVYPFTDFEDNAEWTTNIDNGDCVVIYNTRGSLPRAEETTTAGFGENETELTGRSHTLTYMHKGVNVVSSGTAVNREFYNDLRKSPGQYHMALVTKNKDLLVTQSTCTWLPAPIIEEDIKSLQVYEVNVQWSEMDDPARYDAPSITYQEA